MDRGLVPSRGRPLRTINRGGVSATQVVGSTVGRVIGEMW